MSKRPAFQFYPGDWKKNAKLRRCSPAARGVWMDILCLFHDADGEYGVLRWPLKDVANAAGASMAHVRELVDKGVLKGADITAPAYVYRPKHAGKEGESVVLVHHDDGPVWYSSRMVRDEYVRRRRGESTRFDTANQPSSRTPKGGIGVRQGDGPSSSSSDSEANASAGAAAPPAVPASPPIPAPPLDQVKAALWSEGKALLVATAQMSRDRAGGILAELVKNHGAEVVLDAVRAAVKATPPEPVAYLTATCQHLAGLRRAPGSAPGAAETTSYLAAQATHATGAPPAELLARIGKAVKVPA